MVLVKEKVLIKAPKGKKPTRFRFKKINKKSLRFGFRGKKELVELVKFKEVQRRK